MIPAKYWSPTKKLMVLGAMAGAGALVEDTATGNPLTFITDKAKPLKRLALSLLPRQSGTGDPSPSNIRPLLPWGEVGTWTGGKNLFDSSQLTQASGITYENGYYTGTRASFNTAFYDGLPFLPPFKERTIYTISATAYNSEALSNSQIFVKYTDGTLGIIRFAETEPTRKSLTTTNGKTVAYVGISYGDKSSVIFYVKNIQLEEGATETDYVPSAITPHPVNVGKNLAEYITDYAPTVGVNNWTIKLFELTLKAGTYTFSCKQSVSVPTSTRNTLVVKVGGGAYQYENGNTNYNPVGLIHSITFTLTEESNVAFSIWCHTPSVSATYNEWQVEQGEQASAFQPYLPPVYGAYLDLTTGEVWGTYGIDTLNGSELWYTKSDATYGDTYYYVANGKKAGMLKSVCDAFENITACWGASGQGKVGVFSDHNELPWTFFRPPNNSVTNLNEWKAWLASNPIQVCYELATPVLLATLTPQQVSALVGVNTVWSDADGVDVTYLKKG